MVFLLVMPDFLKLTEKRCLVINGLKDEYFLTDLSALFILGGLPGS
jgi:hypothetical protein